VPRVNALKGIELVVGVIDVPVENKP